MKNREKLGAFMPYQKKQEGKMANFDTHTYANRGRKDNERGGNEQ